MQVHQLKPNHRLKLRKRAGRGGKKGTYSGRGSKGQAARAGRKMVPIIREIIKRYPKLKGYRSSVLVGNKAIIDLSDLEKISGGEIISSQFLVSKRIVKTVNGKIPEIKILADGKISKKVTIENCQVSKSAKEAIEKAGGTIKP